MALSVAECGHQTHQIWTDLDAVAKSPSWEDMITCSFCQTSKSLPQRAGVDIPPGEGIRAGGEGEEGPLSVAAQAEEVVNSVMWEKEGLVRGMSWAGRERASKAADVVAHAQELSDSVICFCCCFGDKTKVIQP